MGTNSLYIAWPLKAECQKIDALKLWCWNRLLKVPWAMRKSKQSILREINPEYSLEGSMLKLKLQYFGHLMGSDDLLEKSLILGKIEDRRGCQRMRWLDGITNAMKMNLGKFWDTVWDRNARHAVVNGVAKSQERLGDWVTATKAWPLC